MPGWGGRSGESAAGRAPGRHSVRRLVLAAILCARRAGLGPGPGPAAASGALPPPSPAPRGRPAPGAPLPSALGGTIGSHGVRGKGVLGPPLPLGAASPGRAVWEPEDVLSLFGALGRSREGGGGRRDSPGRKPVWGWGKRAGLIEEGRGVAEAKSLEAPSCEHGQRHGMVRVKMLWLRLLLLRLPLQRVENAAMLVIWWGGFAGQLLLGYRQSLASNLLLPSILVSRKGWCSSSQALVAVFPLLDIGYG